MGVTVVVCACLSKIYMLRKCCISQKVKMFKKIKVSPSFLSSLQRPLLVLLGRRGREARQGGRRASPINSAAGSLVWKIARCSANHKENRGGAGGGRGL